MFLGAGDFPSRELAQQVQGRFGSLWDCWSLVHTQCARGPEVRRQTARGEGQAWRGQEDPTR